RTHKSFIVNLDYVNEIIPWFNYTFKLRLKHYENNEIPVSRSYLKDFKNKLNI
ncbi:MAG: LytTR family transcriptional regulator DNA-binding domain-containing protein, partial [Tissierellales bacterium]|nr:LytTR family transcriptional regulator DNA-binding domain-containing protein [Tissierellales bacterium]